ncbi:hypothetical protein A1O7_02885 [Cladophialophora yegresii CBS 114405]|uniref:Uncharacterized protein n=1 Tax=Cladophialophora yegresii CBS 114405 TaxID=1182544 RepID=W9WBU2_9EURO|nr:uncharacterized protein A1O7_02885 [Cladophialophora yegresii CBS 114405]EXJ62450.1 hypothetical protein A1O7_02885 [Cladophialophora yegresii CBS 114405]
MATLKFDAGRMKDLSRFDDLNTERGRAWFIILVVDYIRYLKSDPASQADWDELKEKETASKFLGMVNNDRAWPFARQVI